MTVTSLDLRIHGQAAASAWLDEVGALEARIGALQAQQLRAIAGYVRIRTQLDEGLGLAVSTCAYRSMVAEVAIAKGVSQATSQSLMEDAWRLDADLPATLGALETGRLGLPGARAIAQETAVLDQAQLDLADRVIAEEAVDVLPSKVRNLAARRVNEIDPDAASRRAERARREDHVRAFTIGSDTGVLTAQLRADQAAACWHALHDQATAMRADGDERTIDRLMCDTLVERVTGHSVESIRADVCVIMTDTALLGLEQTPAHIVGSAGGPITAQLARLIAQSGSATLRRLYTDPVDATVTALDARKRFADGPLRRLIKVADQSCRGINCTKDIADVDHVRPHSEGGPTTKANLQGLSKGCHISREHPQMRVTASDLHHRAVDWTTPSGREHTTLPPPALGAGGLTREQVRLRHWITHPSESAVERHLLRLIVQSIHAPQSLN